MTPSMHLWMLPHLSKLLSCLFLRSRCRRIRLKILFHLKCLLLFCRMMKACNMQSRVFRNQYFQVWFLLLFLNRKRCRWLFRPECWLPVQYRLPGRKYILLNSYERHLREKHSVLSREKTYRCRQSALLSSRQYRILLRRRHSYRLLFCHYQLKWLIRLLL